jgi:hypothetical protein
LPSTFMIHPILRRRASAIPEVNRRPVHQYAILHINALVLIVPQYFARRRGPLSTWAEGDEEVDARGFALVDGGSTCWVVGEDWGVVEVGRSTGTVEGP